MQDFSERSSTLAQQQEHYRQYAVDHRLVEQIQQQRMAAHPSQRRADRTMKRFQPFLPDQMVQIETGPEQKQPWDQREVIGREETKGVKAQISREVVGVEKARRCDEPMAQLQIAIGCMAVK